MSTYSDLSLHDRFGPDATARLTAVYGEVLASVTEGRSYRIPPRPVRLTIVEALLNEAERGEFDPARLKQAVLSAIAHNGGQRLSEWA
jgi:hypothetical protein